MRGLIPRSLYIAKVLEGNLNLIQIKVEGNVFQTLPSTESPSVPIDHELKIEHNTSAVCDPLTATDVLEDSLQGDING